MPIFEYHCPDCDKDFEELRKFSQRDDTAPCPQCKSRRPTRKISLFASGGTSGGSCGGGSIPGGFT